MICCCGAYVVPHLLSKGNEYIHFDAYDNFISWLDYIRRAVISYSLGTIYYYISKNKGFTSKVSSYRWYCSTAILLLMGKKLIENGAGYSSFLFILLWAIILVVNEERSIWIIDNPVFSFFGRYSFELYIAHVMIIKVFVDIKNVMTPGYKSAFIIIIGSIVLSVLMRLSKSCLTNAWISIRTKNN